jgi:hypothetical protein
MTDARVPLSSLCLPPPRLASHPPHRRPVRRRPMTSLTAPSEIGLRVATGLVEPCRSVLRRERDRVVILVVPGRGAQGGRDCGQTVRLVLRHAAPVYVTPTDELPRRDDTFDQRYDPSRTPHPSHLAAVDATWATTLRKDGGFFLSGYGPGTSDVCGADVSATRTRLAQRGVRACANGGMTFPDILRTYLDPGLAIANAVRIAGGPVRDRRAVSAATFAQASQLSSSRPAAASPTLSRPGRQPGAWAGGAARWADGAERAPSRARPPPAGVDRHPRRSAVVGDGVAAALAAFAPSVTRIAGADRYATAAAVSAASFAAPVPIAFVATGMNFPDALVGAAAGHLRRTGPSPGDGLPEAGRHGARPASTGTDPRARRRRRRDRRDTRRVARLLAGCRPDRRLDALRHGRRGQRSHVRARCGQPRPRDRLELPGRAVGRPARRPAPARAAGGRLAAGGRGGGRPARRRPAGRTRWPGSPAGHRDRRRRAAR